MDTQKITLKVPRGKIEVIVERKNVKNVRLKVYPNGTVKMSAPLGISEEWIKGYLVKKALWIVKSLNNFEASKPDEVDAIIHNGVSTRILGRKLRIIVTPTETRQVECKGEFLIIRTPQAENAKAVRAQFERWWRQQSKAYFQEVLDRFYPIVAKYGVAKPALYVKKMKTLWGSCSVNHSRINLNYYLFRASPPCIEYVVLHELAHFLYPKHDKDFYQFLTIHMPDWKERKKILDYETVKGIEY